MVGRHDAASPLPALRRMLEALRAAPPAPANWMTCAFGADEFACLRESANLGGHIRAGFETPYCCAPAARPPTTANSSPNS